jgi:hypothetical protein
VPDTNLKHEMTMGERARGIGKNRIRDPEHRCLRAKLRTAAGRKLYQRRQAVVEPVFGILKEERGMRKFRPSPRELRWATAVVPTNLAVFGLMLHAVCLAGR